MSKLALISQDAAKQRVSDALQIRIGRGKRYSFRQVAEVTGIPERTIDSYARGDNSPTLANLLNLCAALGPGFTSDVISLAGQSASACDGDGPQHMRALCVMTEASAMLAEALADDHVDHREAAAMRPIAQRAIDLLEPMARYGGGAA